MASFPVRVPVQVPKAAGGQLTASSFTNLSNAVRQVAESAQGLWQSYASGSPLPDGKIVKDRTGKYASSINLRQTGDFSAEVYSADPIAQSFETGFPQRDLKQMLQTSKKTRTSAKGSKYLIIPFGWSASGSGGVGANVLPKAVANWWKSQSQSSITGWTTRLSGSGHTVPQRTYQWGSRLTRSDMNKLGIRGTGARRQMNGMVFFAPSSGGKSRSGGMTFRTMSEKSSGWIVPAKPGLHVAQSVSNQIQQQAEKVFREAFEADLEAIFKK